MEKQLVTMPIVYDAQYWPSVRNLSHSKGRYVYSGVNLKVVKTTNNFTGNAS